MEFRIISPRLLIVLLVSALLLFPTNVGAQVTLDSGSGWIQVVNLNTAVETNVRETFSVNRPNYTIRGGRFDGLQVGDAIIFYVRVEDYFAWDCGWWYVYGGADTVEINVTDPKGVNWTVGSVTTPSAPSGGGTGVANTTAYNFTAADFGGYFGKYRANFKGASVASINFTVVGEPRVEVTTNVSVVNESEVFIINVTITDYNGTGIRNLKVNATDVRTGYVWALTERASEPGNYSHTGLSLTGAGDHIINVGSGKNAAEYALSGTGVVTVSVKKEFYGTGLEGLGLPFFIQMAAAIVHLLSKVSFYLALGFGIVIMGRGKLMQFLLANGGRRVG